jgi:uncharacterized membrane protein
MAASAILSYIFYLLLPVLVFYISYLLIKKAFHDMGISAPVAILIIVGSFLFGYGLIDHVVGYPFSNIPLFTYQLWHVGINTGGAIIPLLLSIYLIIKNKMPLLRTGLALLLVAVITFFVTRPDPESGIVSVFPYWLLPVVGASIISVLLVWKTSHNAAPIAYVSGTMGVLVGADLLHLYALISTPLTESRNAIIGGASIFDMIFLTGMLAVILDGLLAYNKKKKTNEEK